jgi:hypothetical protein
MHHISTVKVEQLQPGADPNNSSNWSPGYFYLYTPAFTLNSTPGVDSNTTPSVSEGINNVGEYNFRYKTYAAPTDCSFTAVSAPAEKKLNAVACVPKWNRGPDGSLIRLPTDQSINVVYPADLAVPVEAAIDAWNNTLGSTGVHLNKGVGGTCAASDRHCIIIDTIAQCTSNALACGCSVPGGPLNGTTTTASKIWIRGTTGNQYSWTDASRQWVFAHEIGHLLGLDEATTTCATGTSVMRAGPCGLATVDDAIAPTASDVAPVVKAVYGNAPLKTCGW